MPPNTLRHGIDAAVKALVNGADHAIVVVPKHFCCAPDCSGYPWKASESRHPCGAVPMPHPDALARLHRIAGAHAGQSDPYIRAILPPVPLEWATPAERQEWREMVIALTGTPSRPDVGIPAAVWQYARAVAGTTL